MNLKKICMFSCALLLSVNMLLPQEDFINESYTLQASAETPTSVTLVKEPTKTVYLLGEELSLSGSWFVFDDDDVSQGAELTNPVCVKSVDALEDIVGYQTINVYFIYEPLYVSFDVQVVDTYTTTIDGIKYEIRSNNGNPVAVPIEFDNDNVTIPTSISVNEPLCRSYPVDTTSIPETTTSEVTTIDDSYVNLYLDSLPNKTTYIIGEELNLDGAMISGNGYEASAGMYWDIFSSPLTQYATIDDSQFDNTKEGTYTIYGKYMGETVSFDVSVVEKFSYEVDGIVYEISNKNGNIVAVPIENSNGVELPESVYIPILNSLYMVNSTGDTPPTQLTDEDYDINGDGVVNIIDLILLKRKLLSLI